MYRYNGYNVSGKTQYIRFPPVTNPNKPFSLLVSLLINSKDGIANEPKRHPVVSCIVQKQACAFEGAKSRQSAGFSADLRGAAVSHNDFVRLRGSGRAIVVLSLAAWRAARD